MEPHPDRDEQPGAGTGSRGGVIAAIIIGGVFLIIVVLHLAGVLGGSPHGS
jgi:hypothetical protein